MSAQSYDKNIEACTYVKP